MKVSIFIVLFFISSNLLAKCSPIATHYLLLPGILSETFIKEDDRSIINLSLFTGSYFQRFVDEIKKCPMDDVTILKGSSESVEEYKQEINTSLKKISNKNSQIVFIAHSLGGVVLLDFLSHTQQLPSTIKKVIFLQVPFLGSPLADVALSNSEFKKIFNAFNTSLDVLNYLSTPTRTKDWIANEKKRKEFLNRFDVFNIASFNQNQLSIFQPTINIIETGCLISKFNKCILHFPEVKHFDHSDGVVPVYSSSALETEHFSLISSDHGEIVLDFPYREKESNYAINFILNL